MLVPIMSTTVARTLRIVGRLMMTLPMASCASRLSPFTTVRG